MSATIVGRQEKDLSKFAFSIQELAAGRSNAVGTVTLDSVSSATSTTVAAPNCGAGSVIILSPATANAAAALATSYVDQTDVTAGQFIVTHDATAETDVIFYWVALG